MRRVREDHEQQERTGAPPGEDAHGGRDTAGKEGGAGGHGNGRRRLKRGAGSQHANNLTTDDTTADDPSPAERAETNQQQPRGDRNGSGRTLRGSHHKSGAGGAFHGRASGERDNEQEPRGRETRRRERDEDRRGHRARNPAAGRPCRDRRGLQRGGRSPPRLT